MCAVSIRIKILAIVRDFFSLIDENTLAVAIADVSGKGMPAALFMVIAKTLIQNTALSGKDPEAVFGIVNRMLLENNDAGMFVTAFLGYLDIPSGKCTFVYDELFLYSDGAEQADDITMLSHRYN